MDVNSTQLSAVFMTVLVYRCMFDLFAVYLHWSSIYSHDPLLCVCIFTTMVRYFVYAFLQPWSVTLCMHFYNHGPLLCVCIFTTLVRLLLFIYILELLLQP